MALSKSKKLTPLENHLKELFFHFVEALQYNPNLWDELLPSEEEYRAKLVELYKDLIIVTSPYSSLEDYIDLSIVVRQGFYERLKKRLQGYLAQDDPFQAMLSDPWWDDQYDLFRALAVFLAKQSSINSDHYFAAHTNPSEGYRQDNDKSGLEVYLDLQFRDGTIIRGLDFLLDHYCHQKYREDPHWRKAFSKGKWVYKVEYFVWPRLHLRVNLSAGKMKIRKAVRELLEKHSSRETEPTPRLRPDTWELRYQVYYLYREEGLSFEEIAPTVRKSYQRVQSLYMEAYEYLHQEDYGTKRTRGETDVKLSERSFVPLEDAENMYTKMQLLGAGSTHFSKQEWDDQKGTITIPPLVQEKYRLCQECKVTPGTEGCWGCITWKNSTSFHGDMEGVPYFRRIFLPPTYPGTGYKGYPEFDYVKVGHQKRLILRDWRWWRIFEQMAVTWGYSCVDGIIGKREFQEGLTREEELSLQAGYISQNGVTLLDPHEAPKPPKGRKMEIIASSASQYSLAFTLRPDLLEWLIVNQIDQRAKKSHHN